MARATGNFRNNINFNFQGKLIEITQLIVNLFFAGSPKLLHMFFLTHPANCSKFNQECPVNTKNIVRRQERDRGGAFVAAQNGVDDIMTLQTEKSYGALLENALDAVFLTRPDGTILYANIWRQSIACGGSLMDDPEFLKGPESLSDIRRNKK